MKLVNGYSKYTKITNEGRERQLVLGNRSLGKVIDNSAKKIKKKTRAQLKTLCTLNRNQDSH